MEFTKAADAPWENGCSEALIKSVKKSLSLAIGQSIMTFSELQTVLFEVANILNERPIGTSTSDPNEGTYLCPNDLILGRASSNMPVGNWDESDNFKKRWKFVQQVVNTFWRKWHRDYFPSLIIRQKMACHNWKLGQIVEAKSSRDGVTRDVTVRYKNIGPGTKYTGTQDLLIRRSAHRIVVCFQLKNKLATNEM
ncbi:unnamed protein product [Mytilus coruscus]|uniref:DUF5641 domain-containing protein n=1 Tax=Mytilus coruscus TaxID=42192 RepID=A0A6J8DLL3_MYTCO|nr:unnamed protein product [Mytilus coruscus]